MYSEITTHVSLLFIIIMTHSMSNSVCHTQSKERQVEEPLVNFLVIINLYLYRAVLFQISKIISFVPL